MWRLDDAWPTARPQLASPVRGSNARRPSCGRGRGHAAADADLDAVCRSGCPGLPVPAHDHRRPERHRDRGGPRRRRGERAFVRRLPRDTGPLAAANEVLRLVEGRRSICSSTPRRCSRRARCAPSSRRRTGRTPASSGPNCSTQTTRPGSPMWVPQLTSLPSRRRSSNRASATRNSTTRSTTSSGSTAPCSRSGPTCLQRSEGSTRRCHPPRVRSICAGAPTWPRHASSSCRRRAHLREPLESRDLAPAERLRLLTTLYSVGHLARGGTAPVRASVDRSCGERGESTAAPRQRSRVHRMAGHRGPSRHDPRRSRTRGEENAGSTRLRCAALQVRGSAQLMVFPRPVGRARRAPRLDRTPGSGVNRAHTGRPALAGDPHVARRSRRAHRGESPAHHPGCCPPWVTFCPCDRGP